MKKKIIFIGYIDKKVSFGPAVVLYNILEQCKNNKIEYKFINTCTEGIIGKIHLLIELIKILADKNKIINVHSFGYKIPYIVYLISKFNNKNKYYLTLHGIISEQMKYIECNKDYIKLEKKIINNFPNIICVSNRQKKFIQSMFNRHNNIFVVYNGVKIVSNFNIKTDINSNIRLIMAGGIFNIKNIFLLLEIVKGYNLKHENKLYLDIYGDYESKETFNKYNNFIKRQNLFDYIKYKGKLDKEKLTQKYKEANFCFAISNYDTFNLTVIEAMSVGTPCIVSEQCGVSEIIADGINGCKVNIDTVETDKIIEIIHDLSKNTYDYKMMCKNAYETSIKFSWSDIWDDYLDIFE